MLLSNYKWNVLFKMQMEVLQYKRVTKESEERSSKSVIVMQLPILLWKVKTETQFIMCIGFPPIYIQIAINLRVWKIIALQFHFSCDLWLLWPRNSFWNWFY